jgi:cobyrinic acid a,c-diamide synthase
VARDAAFCFHYPANLECLKALGAHLAFFSPLADAQLPACDAVWLPGGYPELHGPTLAANTGMAAALRAHVEAGKPLLAECGGMMACFDSLHTVDGERHAGFGLLPGTTHMQKKLAGLGMIAVELPEGRIAGHTFHYSRSETPLPPCAARRGATAAKAKPCIASGALPPATCISTFPRIRGRRRRCFWPECAAARRLTPQICRCRQG